MGIRQIFRRDTYPLIAMNVIDAASTHVALKMGWAYEANPIMAAAWNNSPFTFWMSKMSLVLIGLVLLSPMESSNPGRRWPLRFMNLMYVAILAVHAAGWAHRFGLLP